MHEELLARMVDAMLVAALFAGKAMIALWGV